jgi:hypothetical protein
MNKLLLFLSITLLFACGNENASSTQNASTTNEDGYDFADFYEFYQKFHRDSLFQIAHITWPLEGLPNHAGMDSTLNRNEPYYWQKEDWIMHQPIDFQMSEFRRELTPISEDLIFENITHKSGHYGMVRRWAKLSDGWNLIYYVGMNRIGKEE